jgi:hypothetical protein
VLSNPEIRARLHVSQPPANESLDSEVLWAPCSTTVGERLSGWWQRARACIVSLRAACAEPLRKLRASASKASQWAREHLSALRLRYEVIRPFKNQLLTALGIGLIVAVVVCYAGPWIAALVGGIGGFVTTLAVQTGLWLRKLLAFDAEQAV